MAVAVSLCRKRWNQRSFAKTTFPPKKVTCGNSSMMAAHSDSAVAIDSVPTAKREVEGTSSSAASDSYFFNVSVGSLTYASIYWF